VALKSSHSRRNARQQEPANGEINRELALLRRAYKLGIESERIHRMPTIRLLTECNVRQGFFEPAEFDALLAKLPEDIRALATFAYHAGWRWRSEVAPLTWSQVDLDAGTVTLPPGMTKNGEGRTMILFSPLRELLEAQWSQHVALYPGRSLVFHRDGRPIKAFDTYGRRRVKQRTCPAGFRTTSVERLFATWYGLELRNG
jgi:integrase